MKLKTIIIFIVLLLLILIGSFFFMRSGSTPLPEELGTGSDLPFGSGEGVNIPGLGKSFEGELPAVTEDEVVETRVFRLSSAPVAGYIPLTRGTSTVVRYTDRATGHIFDVLLPQGRGGTIAKSRLTNTTLPKIYEAHFRADGSAVVYRSLKNDSDVIENVSLTLTPPRATVSTSSPQASTNSLYTISATMLRGGIDDMAAGAGNTLFYVLREPSSIVSSTFTGGSLDEIFSSAFHNWRIAPAGNGLLIYTKANSSVAGYAYLLNTSGALTRVAGPLNGLTAVANSNASRILYSYFEGGNPKLFIRNTQAGVSNEILPATLAEKCVWSTRENNIFLCGTPISGLSSIELDQWYLGQKHFSDYLWRFNTNTESAELIMEPESEFGINLDISDPKLSPDENYFIFVNKTDLSLWAVRLN